jgi:ribosomal protein S18 acetylase RimI-like enzyme
MSHAQDKRPSTIRSSTPVQWRVLTEPEWRSLRGARLTALKESPGSFLSSYDKESAFEQIRWREEFSRGEWVIGLAGESIDGLLGITTASDISPDERYLEYLWISPRQRRSGLATNLIRATLERLAGAGINTVWLWILDGNEPARHLYEKCGFTSTGERQPLQADPSRSEERMRLRLKLCTWQLAEYQYRRRERPVVVHFDSKYAFERDPLLVDRFTMSNS